MKLMVEYLEQAQQLQRMAAETDAQLQKQSDDYRRLAEKRRAARLGAPLPPDTSRPKST
jgi:hypothetical protein